MVARVPEHATGTEPDRILVLAKQRRRIALGSAGAMLVLFFGYIGLTTSTTVLSGQVGGLGTAYWTGFAIFGVVPAVAHGYARWARKMDELSAAARSGGGQQ